MKKHNVKNERIKRDYFEYLEQAKQMNPSSVDQVAASISAFEEYTRYKDFAAFHISQAKAFKEHLAKQTNQKTGKPLAKATLHSRLNAMKAFILWLAGQPGYKSKISYSDADYFNLSANDTRIATAHRSQSVATLEQIRHVLANIKIETDIDRRDRALIAFAILSGARDDAIASLKLKHVDPEKRMVFQDARDVRTKNRKTFDSAFFPVGDDIEAIVKEWITYLRTEKLYGPDDPLFPSTKVGITDEGVFGVLGLSRENWKSAGAIRKLFKERFEAAGLPYFNPHSFRKTLVQMGQKLCRSPEEFKAWSQNLGHEQVMTTLTSYGQVSSHRQAEILRNLYSTTDNTVHYSKEISKLAEIVDRMQKGANKI